nr:DUF1493 family protein [Paraburkholderia sp. Cy-641]
MISRLLCTSTSSQNQRTESVIERSEHSAKEAWQQLEKFLRERKYLSLREVLRPDMDIRWDLGMDGHDAVHFFPDFFEVFQIRSGDFTYDKYFDGGGVNIFSTVCTLLFALFFKKFRKEVREKNESTKLTAGMLQRAIELGMWDSQRLMEPEK